MRSDLIVKCVDKAVLALGCKLKEFGFEAKPAASSYDTRILQWSRQLAWKRDVVQVSYGRVIAPVLVPTLTIYVPGRENEYLMLDGLTVRAILNKHDHHRVPTVLVSMRCGSFCHRFVGDVVRALAWFEKHHSPQASLELLLSGDTNHGLSRSRLWNNLETYLRKLVDEESEGGEAR